MASDSPRPEMLSSPVSARPGVPMGPAIPPLNITGLVVSREDLVVALRLFVPQLADITPLEDGRFLLSLAIPADGSRDGEGRP